MMVNFSCAKEKKSTDCTCQDENGEEVQVKER